MPAFIRVGNLSGGLKYQFNMQNPAGSASAHQRGIYSSYVTRDGRPVHRNSGLVTERNLNVRTATLRVGHLARGLYATVTTRIHFDWTTSFLSDALIVKLNPPNCQRIRPSESQISKTRRS